MKVIICAGPPTSGKTTVLKHATKKLVEKGHRLGYLKIDVQYADEDEIFKEALGYRRRRSIPAIFVPITAVWWYSVTP